MDQETVQSGQVKGQSIETTGSNENNSIGNQNQRASPKGDRKNKGRKQKKAVGQPEADLEESGAPAAGGSGSAGRSGEGGNRQQQEERQQHPTQKGSAKLRGLPKDSPEVRMSKTLSWILRHGAKSEGLAIRQDGYVRVAELLAHRRFMENGTSFGRLQDIVKADAKQRYELAEVEGDWMIRARQGHSMKAIQLEMKPILSVDDIPTKIAVHGTNKDAWALIEKEGLSKMTRNHIHLAQGVAGDNVISGMRKSSQILIFIDVQRAIDDGIKFFLSDNGVVLTEGNERGFLELKYFLRVENAQRKSLTGWEGPSSQ
ncbi:hypothetical protein AX16_004515 [Volvariella volvacea WC 439]|nr:hypothetical protein AX16_004515 [Volvariella volvacea WC 439]